MCIRDSWKPLPCFLYSVKHFELLISFIYNKILILAVVWSGTDDYHTVGDCRLPYGIQQMQNKKKRVVTDKR